MATSFKVPVEPALIEWALARSGLKVDELVGQFHALPQWLNAEDDPTMTQLEHLAQKTHTAIGDLLLTEVPVGTVPIPDYRTVADAHLSSPSVNLLSSIYICGRRQDWYRRYAINNGHEPLAFVGSLTTNTNLQTAAALVSAQLGLNEDMRRQWTTWIDARSMLVEAAERAGVLVMIRGIVGASTSRKLYVSEFRGFVLSDDIAPVVFVNGADTKAAQIFTLVHEICHLWLGQSGLDDLSGNSESSYANERWCSRVAAEVLVPTSLFERTYRNSVALEELQRMAREFKVSTLVVLKRVYEAGKLEWDEFDSRYREEKLRLAELLERQPKPSGGNFYKTHPLRVSREFARALIRDTKTGRTLQGDAYRLLGTKKFSTFVNLAKELGVG